MELCGANVALLEMCRLNQLEFNLSPCSAGPKMPLGGRSLLWEAGKVVSSYPGHGEPATSCVTRSEHQREMPEPSNNPC